ncbi:MAG: DNA alkylation repair protein [Saprospiraceae bacterium]
MKHLTAESLVELLKTKANSNRKKTNEYYFKTGKGEYGEGDVFIGVDNPGVRSSAALYKDMEYDEIEKLLKSEIHEVRFSGLIIITERAKKAYSKKDFFTLKVISDFYLKNRSYVNNWDLVDLTSHYILGKAILAGIYDYDLLDELSSSESLWDRRISIVSTYAFIKNGDIFPTLVLSKKLLDNKEDLMHKAIGWMLRESWKVDPETIEGFLMENYNQIPRTALRYAIEKMEEPKRKEFLNINKK